MLDRRVLWSLRARTVGVVALVTLAPLAAVWSSDLADRTVGQRARVALRAAAREAAPAVDDPERLEALAWRHGVRLRVLDAEGTVVGDVDHEEGSGLATAVGALFFREDGAPAPRDWDAAQPPVGARDAVRRAVAEGGGSWCEASDDHKLLVCTAALPAADGRAVVVQQSSRRAIRSLYDSRYQLAKLTLFLAPVALGLGAWLAWRWFRPIALLRDAALTRARAPLRAAPIGLRRHDELGDLADAFDALLAAVADRARGNEAFVADLAHELKNPVAAIRACAEALGGDRAVDEARARRLARVLDASTARLDAVITTMLDLARVEAGLPGEERASVDLGALARGIVAEIVGRRAARARAEGAAVIVAVPGRVESALRNLVDNAASFARSEVVVRVSVEGPDALVVVSDDGPGVPPEQLPRLFERFHTTRAGGTGLGLAMARAVAEAHGGSLEAASPEAGGAEFRMRLPL